jgi:hypothetical protein
MSTPKALEEVQAAWNERDPDKIRGYLDRALAEDVVFVDPHYDITGRDAFEEMVRAFRSNFPNGRTQISSGIDAHHLLHRYQWKVLDGDKLLMPGMDVTRLNEQGLIERIDGFFGPFPPKEE